MVGTLWMNELFVSGFASTTVPWKPKTGTVEENKAFSRINSYSPYLVKYWTWFRTREIESCTIWNQKMLNSIGLVQTGAAKSKQKSFWHCIVHGDENYVHYNCPNWISNANTRSCIHIDRLAEIWSLQCHVLHLLRPTLRSLSWDVEPEKVVTGGFYRLHLMNLQKSLKYKRLKYN